MASDVLAAMDHLQLERAAFVGWSDGVPLQRPGKFNSVMRALLRKLPS
jgi:pimeloyl-ACP methyl ester carboxylesterase